LHDTKDGDVIVVACRRPAHPEKNIPLKRFDAIQSVAGWDRQRERPHVAVKMRPMSPREFVIRALSGQATGPAAMGLRAATRGIEPLYAAAMRLRNLAYDAHLLDIHSLPRPAISVGNITTGGTGKTPLVAWLAKKLAERGMAPGILLRGHRGGDEAAELADAIGNRGVVAADPDRINGAGTALKRHHQLAVFILDDAMQHRRTARDFELTVIDATNPFGFDHVLPRGLLREPLRGLRRADAFLINRGQQAGIAATELIASQLSNYGKVTPIYRCDPVLTELRYANGATSPIASLICQPFVAACGIGNPANFFASLEAIGATPLASKAFDDHHRYTRRDLRELHRCAAAAGAQSIVVTAKDWVKLKALIAPGDGVPVQCAVMGLRFAGDDEAKLFDQAYRAVTSPRYDAMLP
jgi:tetraacyldisaccharide 4'-kinase